MPVRNRVIRDPIYGYIQLPDELAVLVDHPLYQRLRRIGQTSLTSAVYPTATGSRFEHGLGVMHLAMAGFQAAWEAAGAGVQSRFLDTIRADPRVKPSDGETDNSVELVEWLKLAVGGAALLHDLGHPPFSHVLEPLYESLASEHFQGDPEVLAARGEFGRPYHEFAGSKLTETIVKELRPFLGKLICTILASDENDESWAGVLHSIIAGEVDVDRLDYVMRDARKAGTEFGAIDYTRLVDALELHGDENGFRIAAGLRARSAVETLLLQRTQAYKWIIYHPGVVGANLALAEAMRVLFQLSRSEERFGPDESRRTAKEVFGPRWPDLNYLMPSEADLTRRLGFEGDNGGRRLGDQLELDDQQVSRLVDKLRLDMQASVDDGTVTEALKKAGIVAEALLASGDPSETLRILLSEFLTYQQHALFRIRNCIPVWKTVDEFDRATTWMREAMAEAVRDSYATVMDSEPFSRSGLRAILEAERDDVVNEIETDAPVGINRILTEVFNSEERYQQQFAAELQRMRSDLDGTPGVWRVDFTAFTPVKQDENATVLLDGNVARPLYESSKLVQALVGVEASRPRLMVFFYVLYPARDGRKNEANGREMRAKLRGDVMDPALPEFVRMILPNVVRDRYKDRYNEGGGYA